MRLTECPCRYCEKRTAECRLSCSRYKVYHTAKLREYEERRKLNEAGAAVNEHIIALKDKCRKRSVRFTPKKNGGLKK